MEPSSRCVRAFCSNDDTLADFDARAQIPTVTSLSTSATLPPSGSLVRFRAMVQDTGLGVELFEAVNADARKVLMYGAEEEGPSSAAVRLLHLTLSMSGARRVDLSLSSGGRLQQAA